MNTVRPASDTVFDITCDVLVIGAGACGLTAGLKARDSGVDVIIVEQDATPSGSTSMSSGFVPAPATRFQSVRNIEDSPAQFAADIRKKADNGADPDIVDCVVNEIGPTLEWLADRHGLEWIVLDDFLYPGHSAHRMHAVPERTGAALMGRLLNAAEAADLTLVTNARVTTLLTDSGKVAGVEITRPDQTLETIGCGSLILACNGYGGNQALVARHIPEMADALYYGHAGNRGDAVLWGEQLGAGTRDMSAYQGHGSLAHPHGILITWALMMEGGIQVNASGERFSNEHQGYSEQAVPVLAQPGRFAWNIYGADQHRMGLKFPDYCEADAAGAVVSADTLDALAKTCDLPVGSLDRTVSDLHATKARAVPDRFGRDFSSWRPFTPPFHAVRVTGAVFHTQGGLCIDASARVLDELGKPLPNLFAAGGAASGVSGARVEGYLSGNGLLTAIGLGFVAGRAAAAE